mgnify:CR=1 FL=1
MLIGLMAHPLAASDLEAQSESNVKAPFKNYWNSESWEKDSSTNFWRSTSPTSAQTSEPTASGASTSDAKKAHPTTSSRTETKSALHRQSEK